MQPRRVNADAALSSLPLAITRLPPPSSLTMTRCSQFSSSLCSKSHFPSSKVQPTNSLLLRPGTLQKDILSISPFHASPSLLNMQNAFQSIPVCLFIRWVLRVLKLTKVYRFCHLLCWCHCRHLSVIRACGLGDNMT